MSVRDDELAEFGLDSAERVDEKPAPSAPGVDVFDGGLLRGKRSTFAQALAARTARRSPIIQTARPGNKRNWQIGFGPADIPPFSTVNVAAQPRCRFASEKFIVSGDVDDLAVEFFIGAQSQLPRPLSLSTLPRHSGAPVYDPEIKFDVCDPALAMTFLVSNSGPTTRKFSLSVLGAAIL
jgi:hypothetical protein